MRPSDFVTSYLDAWNVHDPIAVAAHLAKDGIYRDIPENEQKSRDELVVALAEFFDRYPQRYELLGAILSNGSTVAFQYRIIPQDGRDTAGLDTYRGAEFIMLDGDSAATITDYYDLPRAVIPRPEDLSPGRAVANGKYAKSGLRESQFASYKVRLEEIMASVHPFLDPNLSLPELAKKVGCTANHLSQVINAGLGVTFLDYVNGFRVERARMLLADPDRGSAAILEIAADAGFNSLSAFYTAFRKHAGLTPAEYRRKTRAMASR